MGSVPGTPTTPNDFCLSFRLNVPRGRLPSNRRNRSTRRRKVRKVLDTLISISNTNKIKTNRVFLCISHKGSLMIPCRFLFLLSTLNFYFLSLPDVWDSSVSHKKP